MATSSIYKDIRINSKNAVKAMIRAMRASEQSEPIKVVPSKKVTTVSDSAAIRKMFGD